MHIAPKSHSSASNTHKAFIPRALATLPFVLKKRKSQRIQAIRADLAARTLYFVDGDDIVITSLDRKPFCCQEELACMCRAELFRVARELNHKLPAAFRIGPLSMMPTSIIRCKIEEVMGFRHFRPKSWAAASQSDLQRPSDVGSVHSSVFIRSTRSSISSFNSASSRSSVPLYVVKESDE